MKLDKEFFYNNKKSYKHLVNDNLIEAQNFPGWLIDFCPSVNLNLEFESLTKFENKQKKVSFWDIDIKNIRFEDRLSKALSLRKSTPVEKLNTSWTENEILFLLNKAIGDGKRKKEYLGNTIPLRNYPSGGAQYPIKLFLLSNFEIGFFKKNYCYSIHPDLGYICSLKKEHNINFEEVFAITHFNRNLYKETSKIPFVIVMVMNLKHSFEKYGYHSKQLAIIESGHIAQNLQLVSTAMGKCSLPNGGILSDYSKEFIGLSNSKDDIVIYGVAFG